MKKHFLIAVLSLSTMGAFSQMKIGIKGGLGYNIPSYKINADSLDKPKTGGLGFTFGGFFEAPVGEGLIFLGELNLTSRAYNTVIDETVEDPDITIRKEEYGRISPMYLEIPLLFKFDMKLNTGKYGADNFLGFYAGPQFSLKLSDGYYVERTYTVNALDQETVTKEEFKESDIDYKPFDLGFAAGVLYDTEAGFRAGLRYFRSLNPVNNNEDFSITHSYLALTVGWNFLHP